MYSERYKFIYFNAPKTASRSISAALMALTDGEAVIAAQHPKQGIHAGLEYYKTGGILKFPLNQYFLFTFVRNPWARQVSAYYFLDWTQAADPSHPKHVKFANFCRIKPMIHQYNCCGHHDSPPIQFDFVGRVENLQNDFDALCDKLGLQRMTVPHINAIKHADYREYYNDETREIIAEKHARDIELFGYSF